MEEYNRDSLRELRRMAEEKPERRRGSFFVTLLIVLLFLAAGGFYLKTSQPELLERYFNSTAVEQKLTEWKDDVVSVFKNEPDDVKETVDDALAKQDEKT